MVTFMLSLGMVDDFSVIVGCSSCSKCPLWCRAPGAVCWGTKRNREMWKSRDYAPFPERASHQFPIILVALDFNTIHHYSSIWQMHYSYSMTEIWASHLPGGSFSFLWKTMNIIIMLLKNFTISLAFYIDDERIYFWILQRRCVRAMAKNCIYERITQITPYHLSHLIPTSIHPKNV